MRLCNYEPDLGGDLGDGADCLLFMLERVVGMVCGWGWDASLGWLMSVVGCESGEKATSRYVVRCYL